MAFDVFLADEEKQLTEQTTKFLGKSCSPRDQKSIGSGKVVGYVWDVELADFLSLLRKRRPNSKDYDPALFGEVVEKVWWAIYKPESPNILVLEVVASFKKEALQKDDPRSQLEQVVGILSVLIRDQGGLAARLRITQPVVAYLDAAPNTQFIEETYQTCQKIVDLSLEVQKQTIVGVAEKYRQLSQNFTTMNIVSKSIIDHSILSVTLRARNLIVVHGAIDISVRELHAVCVIGVSDGGITRVDENLLTKILPYPSDVIRIDFFNGVHEASSFIYTISVNIWVKQTIESFKKFENRMATLREDLKRHMQCQIPELKFVWQSSMDLYRLGVEISDSAQNARILESQLRERLQGTAKGRAEIPSPAVEVSIPFSPPFTSTSIEYLSRIGSRGGVKESLAKEVLQTFKEVLELVKRPESHVEYLSEQVGSMANLSLSKKIESLTKWLIGFTLMILILTGVLVWIGLFPK